MPQVAANLEAVFVGQHNVQQDQVERPGARSPYGFHPVGYHRYFVTLRLQIVFESKSDSRLVLHDQYSAHARVSSAPARGGPARGRRIVKVLPAPASLSRRISPPQASTICRTIDSPIPVPLIPAFFAAAPRTNFWKMSRCS